MNIRKKILKIKLRGLIKEITDIEKLIKLVEQKKTIYCGIDPSCDSLHIGHLIPLKLSKELNDLGSPIIILIGSVTVRMGDPSFLSKPRKLISFEKIEDNISKLKKQIYKIIPEAKIIDNKEWYENMSIIEFFEIVGKLFTINKMLERKSIKKSLELGFLSYDNFSYILMQAFDFYYLWKNYDVFIQIGGSDQFPNIVFGIDMIKKIAKKDIDVVGLTTPLLIQSSGMKFSKTGKNNIWISEEKTRLYDFFQFIYNISDKDIKIWEKLFIPEKINLKKIRESQKNLGFYLICWISNDLNIKKKILEVFEILNLKNLKEIITEDILKKLIFILGVIEIQENSKLIEVLLKTNIFSSISEIRRVVKEGGIKIWNKKIINFNFKITFKDSKYGCFLIKKGKNNWFIFKFS